MNPKKNSIVTRSPWGAGSVSGTGIDGLICQPTRYRDKKEFLEAGLPFSSRFNSKFQKGQLDGVNIKRTRPDGTIKTYDELYGEYNSLMMEYGYTQYHSRNSINFVMSRAARKRGYKATDLFFIRREQYAKSEFEKKKKVGV